MKGRGAVPPAPSAIKGVLSILDARGNTDASKLIAQIPRKTYRWALRGDSKKGCFWPEEPFLMYPIKQEQPGFSVPERRAAKAQASRPGVPPLPWLLLP